MLVFCHVLRYFLLPFLFHYVYKDAPEIEEKNVYGALTQVKWIDSILRRKINLNVNK